MTGSIFNRTIFLWAGAIAIALLIVNPRAALFQRLNTMNETYIDCIRSEHCEDPRAIAEAREHYQILAELYPDYGRGAEMQGICYLLLKQDSMAIKKFQEAVKHNPDLFWVYFELGKAYYRRGEYAQAFKCFKMIIDQGSNDLLKKAALANLRQLSDQTREAMMLGLIDFINDIKVKSYQMAVGCSIHQGNMDLAQSIIDQGAQQFKDNGFFNLANNSLLENGPKKEMLLWIDALARSKPVIHPWGHLIQPMKEILYQ